MGRVATCFWFDVEDYITPESDEALKSLLEIFESRGVKGTWKIVGEKYRVMKQRGRQDILDLLRCQDVGYHTDNHSQHPVISEYVTGLGWDGGVAEFDKRERAGLQELRAEFGHVSCYGQPGGAWSPQAFAVLGKWDLPMYLDEGHHIGLNHAPFWFQNVWTGFNLGPNVLRLDIWKADKEAAFQEAKRKIEAAVAQLEPTGGFISIYYHPCEFSCAQFWDGVNFARGANPARDQWRGAPLLEPAEAKARLDAFARLLDLTLSIPAIDVINATELFDRYLPCAPTGPVPVRELLRTVVGVGSEITYAKTSVGYLTPAEILAAMLAALFAWASTGKLPKSVEARSLLGPKWAAGEAIGGQATVAEVAQAATAALGDGEHMPASANVGGTELAPASLFSAARAALVALDSGASGETVVSFEPARLVLEDNIVNPGPGLWNWTPFPEGFEANDLIDLTALQAWTIKPAVLK